jgi:hypothetical protein
MRKIRGRRIAALALSLVIACSLSACGLSNQSDVTTLAADENGKLTHTIIESVGENGTEKELTAYIKEQIGSTGDSASSSAAGDSVSLQSCKVSGGKATIVMEYSSYQAYEDFNRTACFLGTISEAEKAGYDITGQTFYDENGTAAGNPEEITQRANEWKVLIFEEPMNVRVPDKILYTTSTMKVTGRLTASWKNETQDSASVSGTSASETVSGTSAVGSSSGNGTDGSADDAAAEFEPETGTLTYVIFK